VVARKGTYGVELMGCVDSGRGGSKVEVVAAVITALMALELRSSRRWSCFADPVRLMRCCRGCVGSVRAANSRPVISARLQSRNKSNHGMLSTFGQYDVRCAFDDERDSVEYVISNAEL
jgi:hypothetical protein